MQPFQVNLPGRVFCGSGCTDRLGQVVAEQGVTRLTVLLDNGVGKSGSADQILRDLKGSVDSVQVICDIQPEPQAQQISSTYEQMRQGDPQLLVAIGGGSVLDAAKLLSVMCHNPSFREDITDSSRIQQPGIPLIAVPTSAGTGSEATPNAIVLLPEKKVKFGVVHPALLPGTVFLDPLLTKTMPPAVTASTGIDAFCHCIETFISKKTTPFAQMYAARGMALISRSIHTAFEHGADMEARGDMLLAAYYGGCAISCSSTVAVHALSYPLGGSFHIPHGIANAILLPYVMEYNMDAISHQTAEIAACMGLDVKGMDAAARNRAVVDGLFRLCEDVEIPKGLGQFGVAPDDIGFLTEAAAGVRRLLDQNPKPMEPRDIRGIYEKVLK